MHYRIREAAAPCSVDRSASVRDSYFGAEALPDRPAAARMGSTVKRSKPEATLSGWWRARWRVIGLGVATQHRPAAFAAWMPWTESSKATAWEASPLNSCRTARYRSGEGLVAGTCLSALDAREEGAQPEPIEAPEHPGAIGARGDPQSQAAGARRVREALEPEGGRPRRQQLVLTAEAEAVKHLAVHRLAEMPLEGLAGLIGVG